ncbi:hypothetical protein B0H17DRAFT_1146432 [Mycena rosella]|uniref:Uncharacterized protein n=1 Tax=Mycena rosella TaxID=1033263 RepID=A0AAD7CNV7_MYCRO|nr:hypothetical protein B0H17DRAFT_1146432 [Mycena rosella]
MKYSPTSRRSPPVPVLAAVQRQSPPAPLDVWVEIMTAPRARSLPVLPQVGGPRDTPPAPDVCPRKTLDHSKPVLAMCWTEDRVVPSQATVYPRDDMYVRLEDHKMVLVTGTWRWGTSSSGSSLRRGSGSPSDGTPRSHARRWAWNFAALPGRN